MERKSEDETAMSSTSGRTQSASVSEVDKLTEGIPCLSARIVSPFGGPKTGYEDGPLPKLTTVLHKPTTKK
ncbi:hypothetical protein GCM10027347_31340 [Larkinella harenae]